MQSKKQSLLEAFVNMGVGYIIAVISQMIIFPLVGIHIQLSKNMLIAFYFTVIGVCRMYVMRRLFNWIHRKNK